MKKTIIILSLILSAIIMSCELVSMYDQTGNGDQDNKRYYYRYVVTGIYEDVTITYRDSYLPLSLITNKPFSLNGNIVLLDTEKYLLSLSVITKTQAQKENLKLYIYCDNEIIAEWSYSAENETPMISKYIGTGDNEVDIGE